MSYLDYLKENCIEIKNSEEEKEDEEERVSMAKRTLGIVFTITSVILGYACLSLIDFRFFDFSAKLLTDLLITLFFSVLSVIPIIITGLVRKRYSNVAAWGLYLICAFIYCCIKVLAGSHNDVIGFIPLLIIWFVSRIWVEEKKSTKEINKTVKKNDIENEANVNVYVKNDRNKTIISSRKTKNNFSVKTIIYSAFCLSIIANVVLMYYLQEKDRQILQLDSSLESLRSDYYRERNSRIEYQEKYNKLSEEKTSELFSQIINPETGKPIEVGKSISLSNKAYDYITPYQQRMNDLRDYADFKEPIRNNLEYFEE